MSWTCGIFFLSSFSFERWMKRKNNKSTSSSILVALFDWTSFRIFLLNQLEIVILTKKTTEKKICWFYTLFAVALVMEQ